MKALECVLSEPRYNILALKGLQVREKVRQANRPYSIISAVRGKGWGGAVRAREAVPKPGDGTLHGRHTSVCQVLRACILS